MLPFSLFGQPPTTPDTPTKSDSESSDPLRLLTSGALLGGKLPFPFMPTANLDALRAMLPAVSTAMPMIPMYPNMGQEMPSMPSLIDQSALGFHPYALDGGRRKNATRETTAPLKKWLNDHRSNPYPNKGEKVMLALHTRMTLTQVSTWFANARRRLKKENGGVSWKPPSDDDDNSRPHSSASEKDDVDVSTDLENSQREPEPVKKKIWSIADTLASSSTPNDQLRLALLRQQMALFYGQLSPEILAAMTSATTTTTTAASESGVSGEEDAVADGKSEAMNDE